MSQVVKGLRLKNHLYNYTRLIHELRQLCENKTSVDLDKELFIIKSPKVIPHVKQILVYSITDSSKL